jgi:hypothetical protein
MPRFRNAKHAAAPLPPFAALLAATLLLACGCTEKAEPPDGAGAAREQDAPAPLPSSDPARRPVITVDLAAVDIWLDLVRRLDAGETIPVADYEALLQTTAYRLIDDERKRNNLNRRVVKWTLENVFADRDSLAAHPVQRPDLAANYTYLGGRLDDVASFGTDFCTPGLLDGLRDDLVGFVPPEDLPERISLHIFAGTPLIGFSEPDRFAVDLGLALAAGPRQIRTLLAGRLFAALGPRDGVEPDFGAGGAEQLAGAFRLLRLSAVASWLGGKTSIRFDNAHEQLRGQALHAPVLRENARMILERTSRLMDNLLDPPAPAAQEKYGHKIHNFLRFNDRYETCGWVMAEAIVAHGGEDALRRVSGDTDAFLRAYQAAALAPTAGDERHRPYPFPAAQLEDLLEHLKAH